jgi:hypothetical protein
MPQREAIYNVKAALLAQEILLTLEETPEVKLAEHPAYSIGRTRRIPNGKMRIKALLLAFGCELEGVDSNFETLIVRGPS